MGCRTYNGIVTTDGAWAGGQRVGGTEDDYCSEPLALYFACSRLENEGI